MPPVSLGMRASTSPAVKYRSATDSPLDEDRVHFPGPVDAPGQGELDVGGPARAGDEVDDGARPGRRAVPVPGLEEHADLLQRVDERCANAQGEVSDGQHGRR